MEETVVVVTTIIILAAMLIVGAAVGYDAGRDKGFCNGVATALETDEFKIEGKNCYISIDNSETWVLYTHEID